MHGQRLKELRIDHDETQEQLAALIGVSRKQIGRYEAGEQYMTIDKLVKICSHYHVSADFLLGLPKGLDWPR